MKFAAIFFVLAASFLAVNEASGQNAASSDPDYMQTCPAPTILQTKGPRTGLCYTVVFKRGRTYRFYQNGDKVRIK